MGLVVFANNAGSTLASAITAAQTTITIQSAHTALFPSPSAGDWFPVTLVDGSDMEIMHCTARTGAVLTVVRGREGTTAKLFNAGVTVDHRLTKSALDTFLQIIPTTFAGAAPPPSPIPGQLWWESDTGNLFIWYDDGDSQQWVLANTIAGPPGPTGPAGPAGGPAGPTGPAGAAGVGVPVGGADGQVLTKTSATDFATAWEDPTGGGGGAATSIGDDPPASPVVGQLWWESDTGNLLIWYDDGNSQQWVPATIAGAGSGGAGGGGIISGTGAPTIAIGSPGDYYIDNATDTLYGPKLDPTLSAPENILVGATAPTDATNGSYRLANDFKVLKPGQLVGARFWRSATSAVTTRQLRVFNTTTQTLIGTTVATVETGGVAGWVSATFPAPIAVAENDLLTVAYDEGTNYIYSSGTPTPTDPTHAIHVGIRYGPLNTGFPNAGSGVPYNYFTDLQWQWSASGVTWPVAMAGFSDAPSDSKTYGRKNAAWAEVTGGSGGGSTAWADITGKPATFPPTLPIASSGVTGLDTAQSAQDTAIAGKAPTVHTHAQADVTNLVSDLGLKAPLDSPALTGTPTAPTPTTTDNTTKIATTAYVSSRGVIKSGDTMAGALNFSHSGTISNATVRFGGTTTGYFGTATVLSATISGVLRSTLDAAALTLTVPIVATGGTLSGDLLLNAGDLTITKATPGIGLVKNNNNNAIITGRSTTNPRWSLYLGNSTSEAGSNSGSDFGLEHYSDGGVSLGFPLSINRASGLATVKADPQAALGIVTKQYVDAKITNKITVASTAPSSPAINDLWIDTT